MVIQCACQASDPNAAYIFLKQAKVTRTLIDESHFMVTLRICEGCGSPYLVFFFELIDWSNGDDSQARVFLELDQELLLKVSENGVVVDEAWLRQMCPQGAQVIWSHPRDSEPYTNRISGPLAWFPHD